MKVADFGDKLLSILIYSIEKNKNLKLFNK